MLVIYSQNKEENLFFCNYGYIESLLENLCLGKSTKEFEA